MGVGFTKPVKCKVRATFYVLDKNDDILFEFGTEPTTFDFEGVELSEHFTPTVEEKAQSLRADGSVRLHLKLRLIFDAAAV